MSKKLNIFIAFEDSGPIRKLVSDLQEIGGEVFCFSGDYRPSEKDILREIGEASVLIIGGKQNVSLSFFSKVPELQYIVTLSAGVDHISLPKKSEKEVKLISCAGLNSIDVAEYTVHKIKKYKKNLGSKKVLIIGAGNISKEIQKKLSEEALTLYVWTLNPQKYTSTDNVLFVKDLDSVLSEVDIVSVNIPLSNKTENLLCKQKLSLLKDDVLLINTARGNIIVRGGVEHLLEAKSESIVVADVIRTDETLIANGRLEITNHIAGANRKVFFRMVDFVSQKLKEIFFEL